MESVDKLREWSKSYDGHWMDPETGEMTHVCGECRPSERFSVNVGERLRESLDEIEREHQREVEEAQMNAIYMPNHRVALPMDADGVPIELGDEVWHIENATEHFTVTFFTLDEDGWKVNNHKPSKLLHWEAPTVDVLLIQFVVNASGTKSVTELNALVDEYAERIREAVEHE